MKQPWKLIFRGQSSSSQWNRRISPLLPPPTQTSSPAGSHLFLRPGLRVVLLTCRRRPVVFLQFAGMKRSSRLWARVHKELNATRVPGSLSTHTKYLIPPLLPLLTHPPSDSFFFVLYSFLSCPPSFFPPTLFLPSFPPSLCQYFLSSFSLSTFCRVFAFSIPFFLPSSQWEACRNWKPARDIHVYIVKTRTEERCREMRERDATYDYFHDESIIVWSIKCPNCEKCSP